MPIAVTASSKKGTRTGSCAVYAASDAQGGGQQKAKTAFGPAGFPAGPEGETPFLVLWKWWLLSYQKPLPATPFMAGSGDGWSAPFVVFGTVSESGQPSPSPWA